MSKSILEKVFIDSILSTARVNVAQEGSLAPVLFLHLRGQNVEILPLVFPQSSEEKQAYFARLGAQFRQAGQVIEEAIVLSETWIVLTTEAPVAFSLRPSQHPSRQEAIVTVGRDAANARHALVVQPLLRAAHNQPVWQPIPLASYNQPVEKGSRAVGLLDYLFAVNQRQ